MEIVEETVCHGSCCVTAETPIGVDWGTPKALAEHKLKMGL